MVDTVETPQVDVGVTGVGRSVALNDTLDRCKRQLSDWVACPSGQTHEGKKIIENLRIRIASLESSLATNTQLGQGTHHDVRIATSDSKPAAHTPALSTVGSLTNTFA